LMNYSICYVKHHAIKSNLFKLIAIFQNSVLLILIKLHMKIKKKLNKIKTGIIL
jgi:hypothetical protein